MTDTIRRWTAGASLAALCTTGLLAACSQKEAAPPSANASSTTAQAPVPPPPGDSTPKPAESTVRAVAEGNEKTGASGPQTTVGSAAAGAPPYTLNGAPEGNQAPAQGSKAGEPAKK